MALTDKQELFAHEYIKDLNATQAAIRADYSEKTAYSQGQRLLKNVEIQARVQKLYTERIKRVDIDADYVLQRLVEIDNMDILNIMSEDCRLKPLSDWPKVWRQFLTAIDISELFEGSGDDRAMAGLIKKIKWPDKVKNLELIGKHIGVGAFSERRDHKHSFVGADGEPMNLKVQVSFVEPGEGRE